MKSLSKEKLKAIELRRKGLSYGEILKIVPVAKSSLSLWLKDTHLTKTEKKNLRNRQNSNISKGRIKAASILVQNRINREKSHFIEARKIFKENVSDTEFLIGIALYWAEGSKRDNGFSFINSDVNINKFMFKWIQKYLKVKPSDVMFRLYIHKPYASENCEQYWANELGFKLEQLGKTIYKSTSSPVKKRLNYKGCLRMQPKNSIKFFRYIKAWQRNLIDYIAK